MSYSGVTSFTMKEKRLNLKLKPEIDAMLRETARLTKLKMVTIISNGIEEQL